MHLQSSTTKQLFISFIIPDTVKFKFYWREKDFRKLVTEVTEKCTYLKIFGFSGGFPFDLFFISIDEMSFSDCHFFIAVLVQSDDFSRGALLDGLFFTHLSRLSILLQWGVCGGGGGGDNGGLAPSAPITESHPLTKAESLRFVIIADMWKNKRIEVSDCDLGFPQWA